MKPLSRRPAASALDTAEVRGYGAEGAPGLDAPSSGPTPPPAKAKHLAIGTMVMAVCNAGKLGVQLLLVPVIARLLGPADYGIYSLALPSVTFILMLADAGLGQSLAREDEDHEKVWSSAFWMLLGMGILLAVLLSLWSFPMSLLAHQPSLPRYMAPLSLTVILLALSVSPSARLTRRSRIATYSIIDLVANITASAVAVGAAALHAGVWSLVIQMLCIYGIRAVALNLAAFRMPRLQFDWKSVRSHTAVGGGIVAARFSDSLGKMFEAGIVSRRFGAAAMGSYGFANQVSWSMVQAVNNPIWTAFYVRLLQLKSAKEGEALYHRLLRLVIILTLPAGLLVAANSKLLIGQLLGHSWAGSAFLIALIFPSQALGTCTQLSSAALYADGRSRSQTVIAIINSSLRLAAVFIPFGGWTYVGFYLASANVALFLLGLVNARLSLGWSVRATLNEIKGPLIASAAAGAEAYLIASRSAPTILSMLVSGASGMLVFVLVIGVLDLARAKADTVLALQLLKR